MKRTHLAFCALALAAIAATATGQDFNYPPGASAPGGGGAPTDAQYWTGAADGTLSAEKNLGALGTGLVINTGGVPSIYAGSSPAACSSQLLSRVVTDASGAITQTCVSVTLGMLATQANVTILSNISGGSAVPSANTMTAILDAVFGSTPGKVLTRGASAWGVADFANTGTLTDARGCKWTLSTTQIDCTVVLPSGAIVGTTDTQKLEEKRIKKRTGNTTSSATPTINTDNVDVYYLTAQAAAITSMTTNLSGTPDEGQSLAIWIKDNGTARAITWGASFVASSDMALPTTTTVSKYLYVTFIWNSVASKWFLTGKLDNF